MIPGYRIQNKWIDQLFKNSTFQQKLRQFVSNTKPYQTITKDTKINDDTINNQIILISQQVSNLITNMIQKQSTTKLDMICQQISKINTQIANIKNTVFGYNEKADLQTTYYNKSKLQLSSILQQDVNHDFLQVKSSITQIQQKFNQWFGTQVSQQYSSIQNLKQSKISQFINFKCTQLIQATQKKMLKRIQNTDLLTQRRIQQFNKTLNNVLQMLNQSNNKKPQKRQTIGHEPLQQSSTNQPSLARQSSLQNLKIKSFFNFGGK